MKAVRALAPLLLLLGLGCSVASVDGDDSGPVLNACQADTQCAEGVCRNGICQVESTTLPAVLLEITPPAMSGEASGLPFLQTLNVADWGTETVELNLEAVVLRNAAEPHPERGCTGFAADQGSFPAQVTFTPTERSLGLGAARFSAGSVISGSTHWATVRLPPGTYDVYMEPRLDDATVAATADCPVVPQLWRNQKFESGAFDRWWDFQNPKRLDLRVAVPGVGQNLTGWVVDLVEPVNGRVISNQVALSPGVLGTDGVEYSAGLLYAPVIDENGASEGRELVRLRPPQGQTGLTIFMERAGLELFTAGQAKVDAQKLPSTVVTVGGQLEVVGDPNAAAYPVGGVVTIVATSIENLGEGILASFRQQLRVDGSGRFEVQLLPGSYRVHVQPDNATATQGVCGEAGPRYGAVTVDWQVGADRAVQHGRTIQLPETVGVTGEVLTPDGQPLVGATVQVTPSTCAGQSSVWDSLVAPAPAPSPSEDISYSQVTAPRAMNSLSCENGSFTVPAEPGVVDLSVRPRASSGLPWLVWPNLAVTPPTEQSSPLVLPEPLQLPLPLVRSGVVMLSDGTGEPKRLGNASVRAYVFMDRSGMTATPGPDSWVLQVGETRADSEGNFELLLPSSVPLNPGGQRNLPPRCAVGE